MQPWHLPAGDARSESEMHEAAQAAGGVADAHAASKSNICVSVRLRPIRYVGEEPPAAASHCKGPAARECHYLRGGEEGLA